MEEKIFYEEREYLKMTCNKIAQVLDDTEMDLYTMPNRISDDYVLNELMKRTSLRFINLQKCMMKPYFARIDFIQDGASKTESCYLSKVGIVDYDGNLVTVDWRAPISSLYYDSSVGNVHYFAPDGEIKGELKLKRQFTIEDKELLEYFDVDAVSDDELLKPYLGVNSDSRLKNIVASIQKEQNTIIRANIYDNILIQGVAGSGKTTVALHRIAYLVYNHRNQYKPNQFMVIGPNKYFLSYISSVLPDLDVDNVNQLTYEDLANDFIGEKYKIVESKYIDSQKFKSSLIYKDLLEEYLNELDKNIIPQEDFKIREFTVIKREEILQLYKSENVSSYDNIQSKLDKLTLFLKRIIDDRKVEIDERLVKEFDVLNSDNIGEIYKKREAIRDELLKGCKNSFKKYFSLANYRATKIYKDFIESIKIHNKDEFDEFGELKASTLSNLKNDFVEFEDLPGIMYIKYRLQGAKEYDKYQQVVIDEAQDLGPFNFFILKKMMKNASFSIFGDLAQAIYPYRSIKNWNEVIQLIFNDECEILKLTKSYRTTVEIMNKANQLTKHLGLDLAEPVIRHGEEVSLICVTKAETVKKIKELILKMRKSGLKSIAIICKTLNEVGKIYKELSKAEKSIHVIEKDKEEFESGICLLTCYMAKGLEFDGVIITNASNSNYNIDDDLDMKLLYVSMTRSLHKLAILYEDEMTKVLV